jgi:hypothetical protein
MQQQNGVYITLQPTDSDIKQHKTASITKNNLVTMSIYLAIRLIINPTWLNNRDQFLFPNDDLKSDKEFHNDCLTFTLFNNNIQSKFGVNHWIPFTENEVNAQEKFASNFMSDFIAGKIQSEKIQENSLFDASEKESFIPKERLVFSPEAQAVFDTGRELWRYYHAQHGVGTNASLYDIKEHFQGRNDKKRMNTRSNDINYTALISELRNKLNVLAKKIVPKVYEYGFLKD